MRLGQLGNRVEQGIHKTSIAMSYIALLVLFLMMLLVALDVILRYVFKSPYTGTFDIIEMMMVVVVFGSFAYCTLSDGHVRVDVVTGRLSPRTKATLNAVTFIPSVFIVALISWRLGGRVWSMLKDDLPDPATLTLLIPHWPFMILAVIGSILFCLELIIFLFYFAKTSISKKPPADYITDTTK